MTSQQREFSVLGYVHLRERDPSLLEINWKTPLIGRYGHLGRCCGSHGAGSIAWQGETAWGPLADALGGIRANPGRARVGSRSRLTSASP